jgi:hypothetical protein
MVVGVVGMIGELAGGCELFQQLLNDWLGWIVVGEPIQVGQGRECLHETPPDSGTWLYADIRLDCIQNIQKLLKSRSDLFRSSTPETQFLMNETRNLNGSSRG